MFIFRLLPFLSDDVIIGFVRWSVMSQSRDDAVTPESAEKVICNLVPRIVGSGNPRWRRLGSWERG